MGSSEPTPLAPSSEGARHRAWDARRARAVARRICSWQLSCYWGECGGSAASSWTPRTPFVATTYLQSPAGRCGANTTRRRRDTTSPTCSAPAGVSRDRNRRVLTQCAQCSPSAGMTRRPEVRSARPPVACTCETVSHDQHGCVQCNAARWTGSKHLLKHGQGDERRVVLIAVHNVVHQHNRQLKPVCRCSVSKWHAQVRTLRAPVCHLLERACNLVQQQGAQRAVLCVCGVELSKGVRD